MSATGVVPDQPIDGLDVVGDGDVDHLERGRSGGRGVFAPAEVRRHPLQLVQPHRVVGRVRIAPRDTIDRGGGERVLDREHGGGVRGGFVRGGAREREKLGDVRDVLGAQRDRALVGLQVVVAIGQRKAALIRPRDLLRRVALVGLRREAEQDRHVQLVQVRDDAPEDRQG